MSGKVIHQVQRTHECSPGWTTEKVTDPSLPFTEHMIPPYAPDYPPGTVWECECGALWVSTGAVADNMPGVCGWKREGSLARWRRRRADRQR